MTAVERARELLAAATPGPWHSRADCEVWSEDGHLVADVLLRPPSDARFIAAAPSLLAELADDCERQAKQIAYLLAQDDATVDAVREVFDDLDAARAENERLAADRDATDVVARRALDERDAARAEVERLEAALRKLAANPPDGWHAFGTHVDRPDVPLEFCGSGLDGLPMWERSVPEHPASYWQECVDALGEDTVNSGDETCECGHIRDEHSSEWPSFPNVCQVTICDCVEFVPRPSEGDSADDEGAKTPCPNGRTDYEACFAPFRYCPVKGCGRIEQAVGGESDE